MIVSGPQVLWEATRSATPVLLTCAAGAWVLANAILRDEDAGMSGNRVLRIAGLVLVLSILPLTGFAAVSMGARVAQHGLSPERLWGLVAIAVGCLRRLVGVGAAVGLAPETATGASARRSDPTGGMICGVSLSARPGRLRRHQRAPPLSRLETGREARRFRLRALRWDFGAAGGARSRVGSSVIRYRQAARERENGQSRYRYGPVEDYNLRTQPADSALKAGGDNIRSNPWTASNTASRSTGATAEAGRVHRERGGFNEGPCPSTRCAEVATARQAAPALVRQQVEIRTRAAAEIR